MGSAIALLEYESTDNTVLGGIDWKLGERLELGFDAVWTDADAALDPFDFVVPEDYLAVNPNMSYDFNETYTSSDLDVSRVELGFRFHYEANELLAVWGGYRYLDFEDDAPYLYDTSGQISLYSLGLAWTF